MCSTRLRPARRGSRRSPRSRGARGSSRAGSRPGACRRRSVDRRARRPVGLELADVVQQRAGDGDVAVDAREARRSRSRPGPPTGVLEQPVAVGLVVVLRRRRVAVARPQLGALADQGVEEARAGTGSGSWRSARAGRPPSRRRRAGRRAALRGRTPRARRGARADVSCGP